MNIVHLKHTPRFIGPFTEEHIINPSAVRLCPNPVVHIHPTFHMSQIKHVLVSPLCLLPTHPTHPSHWQSFSLHCQPAPWCNTSWQRIPVPSQLGGLRPRGEVMDSEVLYFRSYLDYFIQWLPAFPEVIPDLPVAADCPEELLGFIKLYRRSGLHWGITYLVVCSSNLCC